MRIISEKSVRIRENSLLARIAAQRLGTKTVAMVIARTIYLHGVSRDEFLVNRSWLCHELRHVAQYERYGTIGFLARYLLETIRHGYANNRLEVEARASENDEELFRRYTIKPPPSAL